MFGYRSDQLWAASVLWKQKSFLALSPADQDRRILALCSDLGNATYNRKLCHSHHQLHSLLWKMNKRLLSTTSFCYDEWWGRNHDSSKDQEKGASLCSKTESWNNQWHVPLPFHQKCVWTQCLTIQKSYSYELSRANPVLWFTTHVDKILFSSQQVPTDI